MVSKVGSRRVCRVGCKGYLEVLYFGSAENLRKVVSIIIGPLESKCLYFNDFPIP